MPYSIKENFLLLSNEIPFFFNFAKTYSSFGIGMISEVEELEIFSMFSLPTATLEESCGSTVESVSSTSGLNFFDSVFCVEKR